MLKTLAEKEQARLSKQALKREVLSHYCGGKPHCQCLGCRVVFLGFLQIDHVLGDGSKHRNSDGRKLSGSGLWRWLKKNKYPPNFQVLCANCNSAKGTKAQCPLDGHDHQGEDRWNWFINTTVNQSPVR